MKRIILSSNTSWSIYNYRLGLVKELLKFYEVIVVAPKDKYSHELIKIGCKYYDIFIDNKGTNPINDLKTFQQYYKLYKKLKPDIALHFTIKSNIYGNFACNLLDIPVINNVTGLGTVFIKESFVTKMVKSMYKLAFKNSFVFFQNYDDKEIFVKLNLVKNHDVLPGSGIDTEKFQPLKTEKKDNIFRFLLIARMLWDKGIGEYIEAAKIIKLKYKNVEFLLLGAIGIDNPTAIPKEKILEWEKEKIIKYLGTTDNIKEKIAYTDCIVLPSYREGTSRTLLEAAAIEKPIVTTNVPGCKGVVEDGVNGFLCNVKDSIDLADKMEKILNLSEEERKTMGKKGREKVIKEFDEKIVIEKYMEAIKDIL
ncbi:glycosyltransferase family 4 protein [Nitrosophilus alvini]|uniref:glycosyltransferase family 4 protein n=1 Tax=Nitrosophilus alvini TaxID=2714855 RepID=UPI00190CCC68|nr:glycosyltransferase family 4 protein [Nitrosophilus alvini]